MKRLFIREEYFDAEIPKLEIKWDRIPFPTKETREVTQVKVRARRTVARNWLGKVIVRGRFRHVRGPAALTGPCSKSLTSKPVLEQLPVSFQKPFPARKQVQSLARTSK